MTTTPTLLPASTIYPVMAWLGRAIRVFVAASYNDMLLLDHPQFRPNRALVDQARYMHAVSSCLRLVARRDIASFNPRLILSATSLIA